MPQYLVQARRNGNVVKSLVVGTAAEIAAVMREAADLIAKTQDAELIHAFSVGVQQIETDRKPVQYHSLVLFTIDPNQAETEHPPSLAEVREYLEDAAAPSLDCDEHGNKFGFTNPVLLSDTIVPADFKVPEPDVTLMCDYFRRKGYVPNATCYYLGEKWNIVGFPFPTEDGIVVCIRHAEDNAYVKQPDVLAVSLTPQ